MKKIVYILLTALMVFGVLCSCGDSNGGATGLRKINWGMTRSEVRKIETAEFVGADDAYIRFYDKDLSQPIVSLGASSKNKVDLWYYFNSEDKLFKIEYRLANKSLADSDYDNMKSLMSNLYGSPYEEDASDPEDENTKFTSWKKAKSDITLSYHGGEPGKTHSMYVTFLPNN